MTIKPNRFTVPVRPMKKPTLKTILIVDDNSDYRAGIAELLEFEQYTILQAENGLVALQIICQQNLDLILSDLEMPTMSGLELLKAVKAEPKYAPIPFIVVSGSYNAYTRETARRLGAQTFLTKPLQIADFLTTLFCYLHLNRSR